MGISSRDYYRDQPTRGGGFGYSGTFGMTNVVKWIIIANIAVFVLQLMLAKYDGRGRPAGSFVDDWFSLDPVSTIYYGQVWRVLTYAFLHDVGSLMHLLFNMLFFWFCGRELEQIYGSREFLWFYLTSAVMGGLMFLFFSLYFHDATPAIGASGAVMATVMLYACHFPHQLIYIFWGLFPVPVWALAAFYVATDLFPLIHQIRSGQTMDSVAHTAHLGGFAFGFLYYQNQWRVSPWISWIEDWIPQSRAKSFRPRPRTVVKFPDAKTARTPVRDSKLKVFHGEDDVQAATATVSSPKMKLDEQVDQILRKIKEHGESSLTDEERNVMNQAAEEYKRKKKS
jgi:membrane associated rhomboid family serine protease